jgi:hypothetical protein
MARCKTFFLFSELNYVKNNIIDDSSSHFVVKLLKFDELTSITSNFNPHGLSTGSTCDSQDHCRQDNLVEKER